MVVHSLLASSEVKGLAQRIAGRRFRNGWYRLAYVAQSLATVGWATWWFVRLPDRELYRVPPPWSWTLRLGQGSALALLLATVKTVGFADLLGLTMAWGFITGRDTGPEPEAQGPPPGPDGRPRPDGPFRFVRHPDNLPLLLLFSLFPRMTVNRATLAALTAVYAVLGSLHEDRRLRARFGPAFRRYEEAVPFLLPRLRRRGADRG
jgi:uncharacterized membrane protein